MKFCKAAVSSAYLHSVLKVENIEILSEAKMINIILS